MPAGVAPATAESAWARLQRLLRMARVARCDEEQRFGLLETAVWSVPWLASMGCTDALSLACSPGHREAMGLQSLLSDVGVLPARRPTLKSFLMRF